MVEGPCDCPDLLSEWNIGCTGCHWAATLNMSFARLVSSLSDPPAGVESLPHLVRNAGLGLGCETVISLGIWFHL
jgi:hypothetical protein